MFIYDIILCFFKQKQAYEMRISDWSSDVCSSDLLAEELATDQFIAQRIGLRLGGASGWPSLGRVLFPVHLDRGRRDRNGHEHDGAKPGEQARQGVVDGKR